MKKLNTLIVLAVVIAISSILSCKSDDNKIVNTESVTDLDGNTYKTVKIGNQIWMAENLRTTKFNDGQEIPKVSGSLEWGSLSTPGYCFGPFNPSFKNIYGAFYNWYSVKSGKLAPKGWHIPSEAEWKTLATYLGGETIAGGKMKTTGFSHWHNPNTGATNESGFSAYPAGYRNYDGYEPDLMGDLASFWTSNEFDNLTAIGTRLACDNREFNIFDFGVKKTYGYSIRCVKD